MNSPTEVRTLFNKLDSWREVSQREFSNIINTHSCGIEKGINDLFEEVTIAYFGMSQWILSRGPNGNSLVHNKVALPFYTKAGDAVWYSGPGKHHCQASYFV